MDTTTNIYIEKITEFSRLLRREGFAVGLGESEDACRAQGTPYVVSVGIGCDALKDGEDTLQECMRRADEKLYLDKAHGKRQGHTTRVAF